MNAYKVDVPVLLIFFNRPEPFSKVFEQVKRARPSKLFLYQDGIRKNKPNDARLVMECRRIAEDIDWECEVQRFYQTENKGCDPSEYIAIKWAFSHVDKCIVLEDDDVPSQSFFPFCKELLERYENDQRINMICGMNTSEISDNISTSYSFSRCSTIWGWASWKRVIDEWDGTYSFLDDKESMTLLKDNLDHNYHVAYDDLYSYAERHRQSGREHYESILAFNRNLNGRLNIIPKYNLISNIGVQIESTHTEADIRLLCRAVQKLYTLKTFELEFPLTHPKYVIENYQHAKKHMDLLAINRPFRKIMRAVERKCRMVLYKHILRNK